MRHWLQFIRDHFEVWKNTTRIGDLPGVGAAEVYAHIVRDHGFLCLVNQNPFPRTTTFTLDGAIGLDAGETFELNEVYPRACPIAEQPLPAARRGDRITCVLPAHSVRIIEVKTAPKAKLPVVFGLPATIKRSGDSYQVIVRAPQGQKVELGLVLPVGQAVEQVSARQTPTVPMFTFPAAARVLSQTGNLARIEVQFPREPAPRELTHWRVSPGDVEVDLPPADRTRFLGALVHNAFTEDYEVQLEVQTKPAKTTASRLPAEPTAAALAAALPTNERLTYTTRFVLPFIEARWGCNPSYDDDPLIELAFADPKQVREIEARLNGVSVPVQRYRNPKQPAYATYFIELTENAKPGPVELTLDVLYQKHTRPPGFDLRKIPTTTVAPTAVAPAPVPAPAKPLQVAPEGSVIRIDAGSPTNFTDAAGNLWLSDRGFEGGECAVRENDMKIENTTDAGIYRTEHWGMSSFSQPLHNGKYVVKLHFAETFDGITGPGERVFSFTVEGREFKGFDIWAKAGGPRRATIETVNIEVTDGKLDLTFESDVDNPAINGIEIIPAP
ncbi:MAG: malectin, partial [Verrucomicrobia bacterium]|jgi:hypothetical protein|nr:malectin [Verrucomicrobiota bacterium]